MAVVRAGRFSRTILGAAFLLSCGADWALARPTLAAGEPFTIRDIRPDIANRSVEIQFTQAVEERMAREHFFITPPPPQFHFWQKGADALVLRGNLQYGTRYFVKFSEGFRSASGTAYTETLKEFTIPHLPPALRFSGVGTVVELKSRQLAHFDAVNVGSTLLETIAISPLLAFERTSHPGGKGNTPALQQQNAAVNAALEQALPAGHPLRRLAAGGTVRRELYDTKGKLDEEASFSIPLSQRADRAHGAVLLARLRDNAAGGTAETEPALFNITDLGITCLAGGGDALIWVTSLETGLPLAGVEIAGLADDRFVFAAGKTDADGILRIPGGTKEGFRIASEKDTRGGPETLPAERFHLRAVVAYTEDDVALHRIPAHAGEALALPGNGAGGSAVRRSYAAQRASRAKGAIVPSVARSAAEQALENGFVFTERGVYRPGETVSYKGVVRRFEESAIRAPAGDNVRFTISDARGRQIDTRTAELSAFGTAAGQVVIPASAPLGEYRVDLAFGLGLGGTASATFRVEEFVPPRHFARVRCEALRRRDDSYVGRSVEMTFLKVGIEGGYYAGGPVKNGRVRWQLSYGPSAHPEKGYDDYVFGHEAPEETNGRAQAPLESGESFLDADGKLALEFPVSHEVLSGERTLVVAAAVLDFDGRAAAVTQSWRPETPYQIGILAHDTAVTTGDRQLLSAILIDKDRERVRRGALTAEVLRQSWTYSRKRNLAGNEYWVNERVWKRSSSAEVPIRDGAAAFEVAFDWGGEYLVRFSYRDDGGAVYSSATYYRVGWGGGWDEGQRADQAYSRLLLSADRARYRPGQTARLRIGPGQGAAAYLFSLERQGVLSYKVLRPKEALREIEVPLGEAQAPNVYASLVGTVPRGPFPVYPGRIDEGLPAFQYGLINLPVVLTPTVLAVEIAPAVKGLLETEPGREITLAFAVKGEDGRGRRVELAVAVVDETVLALTGHRTPDLQGLARFDAPLGVLVRDLRSFLLPQTPFGKVRNEALSGGSEGEGPALETRKLFRPTAYWNPALVTGDDGRAEVRFTLPDQMTSFRVAVVACDAGTGFGTAERQLRVTKPFSLEPGLPRFFTQGDTFGFDVAAFNRTNDAGAMEFSLATTGGLSLATASRSYPLAAGGRTDVRITGKAEAIGGATVSVAGTFGERRDAVEMTLPVHSGFMRGQQVWYGSLKGETTLAPVLPESVRAIASQPGLLAETSVVLTLSGSPFLRMTEGLRYLLQYPYGCVEQTSSGVLPLAALRGILRRGLIPGIEAAETDVFLEKGVERLISMQTGSGGFGYWPGDRAAHPWGTFYAATALAEARDAGVPIPEDALRSLANYLRSDRLRAEPKDAGGAYAFYLLSRLGQAQAADFELLRRTLEGLPWEERTLALLGAAAGRFLEPGALAAQARAAAAVPGRAVVALHGFASAYRGDALALLLLDQALPGGAEGSALATKLLEARGSNGYWQRTSDTGWVLAALGRHFAPESASGAAHRVAVRQPGGAQRTVEFPATGSTEITLPAAAFLAAPSIGLSSDPGREILTSLRLVFPRVDYAEKGSAAGFHVAKRIENAAGGEEIRVGDIVQVTVEFTAPDRESEYIAVDDPLPAGLVAINTAFQTEEKLPAEDNPGNRGWDDEDSWFRYWSPDGYYRFVPDHLEMRDDRVTAFRNELWGWGEKTYRFVYFARAVCAGEFVVPSTKVERMYEPDVNGYTPRRVLTIGGRMP